METDNQEIFNLLTHIKSKQGQNLYEHLQRLYETKIELNDDEKFLDLFEDISLRIRTKGDYFNEAENRESLLHYLEEFEKNSKKKKTLLGALIKPGVDGGEPELINQVNFVPEYHNLFQSFEWAGVSIGEKESYMLTNSLRSLVNQKGLLTGVVFWGKIYGRENDYWVAEANGVEASGEGTVTDLDFEKRNEDGVNKNTYYVTTDLTQDWVELPDIKPGHIRQSRQIRYIFTGDLNRKIVTNPHFPGLEKDFLRCQIARITHGTKIEPSINHWTVPDPENPFKALEKNTDESKVKPMKLNDYLTLSNWIHFPPAILNQGRVQHYIEYPEDVNQEEYKLKMMNKDPFPKRIKSIIDDSSLVSSIPNVKIPCWRLQYLYDDRIYINPNVKLPEIIENTEEEPKDNTQNYIMICLKSLRWPGAYTMKVKTENHFFYFGWGLKFADYTLGEKFVYQDFPFIPKDKDDFEDYPEPNSPPHEMNEGNVDKEKAGGDMGDD